MDMMCAILLLALRCILLPAAGCIGFLCLGFLGGMQKAPDGALLWMGLVGCDGVAEVCCPVPLLAEVFEIHGGIYF